MDPKQPQDMSMTATDRQAVLSVDMLLAVAGKLFRCVRLVADRSFTNGNASRPLRHRRRRADPGWPV